MCSQDRHSVTQRSAETGGATRRGRIAQVNCTSQRSWSKGVTLTAGNVPRSRIISLVDWALRVRVREYTTLSTGTSGKALMTASTMSRLTPWNGSAGVSVCQLLPKRPRSYVPTGEDLYSSGFPQLRDNWDRQVARCSVTMEPRSPAHATPPSTCHSLLPVSHR